MTQLHLDAQKIAEFKASFFKIDIQLFMKLMYALKLLRSVDFIGFEIQILPEEKYQTVFFNKRLQLS